MATAGTLAQYDVVPGTQVWHDFVGTSMWNDYEAGVVSSAAAVTPLMEYTHGMGLVAQQPAGGAIRYAHADMLGTTRYMTDSSGDPAGGIQYSAFGEPLGPAEFGAATFASRYGYVGAYGYQNDALADAANDFGLLYVGARYYDPALGRFIMRDPIGILGGISVYAYCGNNPLILIDPEGTRSYAGDAGRKTALAAGGIAAACLAYGTYELAVGKVTGSTEHTIRGINAFLAGRAAIIAAGVIYAIGGVIDGIEAAIGSSW